MLATPPAPVNPLSNGHHVMSVLFILLHHLAVHSQQYCLYVINTFSNHCGAHQMDFIPPRDAHLTRTPYFPKDNITVRSEIWLIRTYDLTAAFLLNPTCCILPHQYHCCALYLEYIYIYRVYITVLNHTRLSSPDGFLYSNHCTMSVPQ